MANARILQSFIPPEESFQGLAWVHGKIWTASAQTQHIFRGEIKSMGAYEGSGQISSPVKNPGGLTWDGQDFLVADRLEKIVFKVNPESSQTIPLLTLTELKYEDSGILQAASSLITDITWGQGHLWVACQAGYSSSVFRIDLEKASVVKRFWARGPNPEGISFDKLKEYVWTVDARNREFSQFTPDGNWTEQVVPSPVARPSGLALDDEDAFWTSDRDTKQIYQIKREA